MSSRLAPDEKICSVRELICSVSGQVCCTSLRQGLTNLPPCAGNFGQNQRVTLDHVFVVSDDWRPVWHLSGACACCSREATGNAESVSKPWEGWWWGLGEEKNSEKMQLFSKAMAGLRRQRGLLKKLKRSSHVSAQAACSAWCAVPGWHRRAQSMALAQD